MKDRWSKRKLADFFRYGSATFSMLFSLIVLFGILIYIFSVGSKRFSLRLFTADYEQTLYTVSVDSSDQRYTDPGIKNSFFSSRYGVCLEDGVTLDGQPCIKMVYIASGSPFTMVTKKEDQKKMALSLNLELDVLMGKNKDGRLLIADASDGAKVYAEILDQAVRITSLQCKQEGGGIRGSLVATLLLIGTTLLIALPLGIGAAIYLVEYAKEGKIKRILWGMIDLTSGIPSIIFGFCGAIIFIPFVSAVFHTEGYSILAGSLTMTLILLPTIIKTTAEALQVIPDHYRMASLALGASKTQTVFKIMIPSALPGILTATLLSIGRIIGESAALIFVMGTNICDQVHLLQAATSLSLHIWSITRGDVPNYETACAVSMIILMVVFVLSLGVKLLSKRMNKMGVNL